MFKCIRDVSRSAAETSSQLKGIETIHIHLYPTCLTLCVGELPRIRGIVKRTHTYIHTNIHIYIYTYIYIYQRNRSTICFPFCGGDFLRTRTECFVDAYCTHSTPLGLFPLCCSASCFRISVLFARRRRPPQDSRECETHTDIHTYIHIYMYIGIEKP